MKTPQRLQKITSKGQMTLPVAWRNRVKTNTILVSEEGDTLRISPAHFGDTTEEYTVFDALRDNNGKGIPATHMIKILKKLISAHG